MVGGFCLCITLLTLIFFIVSNVIVLMTASCRKDRLNIECCIIDCGDIAEHFRLNKPYCKRHFNIVFYLNVLEDAVGVGD